MNLKELKKLVSSGESDQLEFKTSTGQRTAAMKTACAMLNGLGGFVLFGVSDKGNVVGQDVTAKTIVTFKPSDAKTATEALSPTQSATQSTDPVTRLMEILTNGPLSSGQLRDQLNLKHRPTFRKNYLRPALNKGYIEMTIPEKPQSRLQKYRLTEKGRQVLNR